MNGKSARPANLWSRLQLATIALLPVSILAGAMWYAIIDPETATLDEHSRAVLPGRFIRLHDGYTWYDLAGPESGEPLVLVHGLAINSFIWDRNVQALAEGGYRVLRYDQYGRGYSDRPMRQYDHALLIRQLRELLNELWIARPIRLICVSAGCPVAAGFALAFPQRVARLVMIDPQLSPFEHDGWRDWPLIGEMLALFELESLATAVRTAYPAVAERFESQRRFIGYRYAMLNIKRSQAGLDPMVFYSDLSDLSIPTALIQGVNDRGQARRTELIHRAGIDSFREIQAASHGANYRAATAVNEALLGLLAPSDSAVQNTGHHGSRLPSAEF